MAGSGAVVGRVGGLVGAGGVGVTLSSGVLVVLALALAM